MASLKASCSSAAAVSRASRSSPAIRPALPARRCACVARAQKETPSTSEVARLAAIGSVAAPLLLAEHAQAATEVAQLAASDNRIGVIATLFVPALGWVAFNMLSPLLNQLDKMTDARSITNPSSKKKRSFATAVGLGAAASLLMAEHADAATEVAQLAASDGRFGVIATLFVPALGWVGFNMLSATQAQLDKMNDAKKSIARGFAGAVGLGVASLMLAEHADAATEVAQLAAGDGRLGVIGTLFVPALGWVGFNMLSATQAQLDKMTDAKKSIARGFAGAVGLGAASMLLAENADAATEVAQLAASDGRVGVIATLFVPALGWVAFNALQPALNQLDKMTEERASASPSSVVRKGRK